MYRYTWEIILITNKNYIRHKIYYLNVWIYYMEKKKTRLHLKNKA